MRLLPNLTQMSHDFLLLPTAPPSHLPFFTLRRRRRRQRLKMMKIPLGDHHFHFLSKKPLHYAIFAILPVAIVFLVFSPPYLATKPVSFSSSLTTILFSSVPPPLISESTSTPQPSLPPPQVQDLKSPDEPKPCNFAKGKWVPSKSIPLYNGTCSSIKPNQNCMNNGKDELGFLFWKWKPHQCDLPRFDPSTFLNLLKNKNLAFVGDSLARNQLESLICMLSSAHSPTLVYKNGDENKFRRWWFHEYNVSISVFWSPFLVKGTEKSSDRSYNELFFDGVDERWGSELGSIDVVVLSIGHWYLLPAVYYEGGSVIGCHVCEMINHNETGFYEVYRKGFRVSIRAILERKSVVDVFVTTFPPSHFEGEWDKAGACPRAAPEEREVEGMDWEMRRIGLEEVEFAKRRVREEGLSRVRVDALDVTELAIERPDGHPGPFMNPFPYADGVRDRVQNDCVHWCLPGVIDTWNEIMLEIMKRYEDSSAKEG